MPIKERDFKKLFKKYGVTFENDSRHPHMIRIIDGSKYMYPYPVKKGEVKDCYIKDARRKFKLLPENGISDEEFFKK